MPVQSALTLDTKVHNPRGTESGISKWVCLGDTAFGGSNPTLTESVRQPLSDGGSRTRWLYTVPVLATVDSPCSCAGQPVGKPAKVDVVIDFPAGATAAQRASIRKRIQDLVLTAAFVASVEGPEGSWG